MHTTTEMVILAKFCQIHQTVKSAKIMRMSLIDVTLLCWWIWRFGSNASAAYTKIYSPVM